MTETRNKRTVWPWAAQLSDSTFFNEVVNDTTQREPGIVLLNTDGNRSFVSEADLKAAAEANEADAAELLTAFQKAADAGYDATNDAVCCFRGNGGPVERLSTKNNVRVRAWLVVQMAKSVKRINLAEVLEEIKFQAYRRK